MTSQPHEQTSEELTEAITLLMCIGVCTESEVSTDWHQSLQSTIQSLVQTVDLLNQQSYMDSYSLGSNRAYGIGAA